METVVTESAMRKVMIGISMLDSPGLLVSEAISVEQ